MQAASRERSVSASGNGRVQDLLVVGGGMNGCGIARDAAGRGLSVLLCEKGDLAGATSSASTKLIHGGLRYLEYREFRLVREALIEREVLLRAAPHIIWPLRFVLPHHTGLRPGRCCGSACSSTTISAGAASCRRPAALDLRQRPGRRGAEAASSAAASNIPTAGSRMPGWSC